MTLMALAPAKINRELRVGGLRSDGYHEIWSRMVSISVADTLTAEPSSELEFFCDDPDVPSDSGNLVVRAAELLAQRARVPARVRLRLDKKVPIGAGLGGGSADAAIALRLLARFWNLRDAEAWLPEVAVMLGSDVPFFLVGGEAEVRGRGEKVTSLDDGPAADLLLLVPPFSISTAEVYNTFAGRGTLPTRLKVADGGVFLGPNDLAPAVLQKEPRMRTYLESAAGVTPEFAISGSGATIVLHGAGSEAEETLRARHPEARLYRCHTLTRRDYRHRTNPTGGIS
ncbi:MAG TPA: 4-(cytidine 5'-diphospho)-2-C-methyl-D-erythritol kinase [Thermoanaerobaculia bacterium]|jgi:4-diphosphocytidyl-2-C-methyl-D-erythritol kinase